MAYRKLLFKLLPDLSFVAAMLCITMLASCSGWSREEKIAECAYTALHIADWSQTREAASRPDAYHETNPLMGSYPSTSTVDIYMGSTLALHWVVTGLLPRRWRVPIIDADIHPRAMWQYISIGVEASYVANNISVGVRGEF
ncbi:MAG: hypothetical protein M0036_05120 [Desulfobacteraceae bacterium]|nr:hypothetical protein [Desulfobacteraceae bacterium]